MSDLPETPAPDTTERKEQYLARVSHVGMGLIPKNMEEGMRLAELLSRSTLVPEQFRGNAGNVFLALQLGAEVGLPPMQALSSIAVVNGKPSLYGDGLLAVCITNPLCEWVDEPPVTDVATCNVKRKGWPNPISRTFSVEDAKKAGLWGKSGPWSTNPTRMLRMRARAFALRDAFADVLRGLASAEEMLDITPQVTVTEQRPADPAAMLQAELGATDDQYAFIVAAWDTVGMAPAARLVQARQYAHKADDLVDRLRRAMMAPSPPAEPPAPIPSVVTPLAATRARKRVARTKAEAQAPPAAAVAESIADAMGPDTLPSAAAVLGPGTGECCEHGVLIDEPCDACVALADELAAKDLPKGATPPSKQETPAEYAARRKQELAALNAPLPNVAPLEKAPF
jgi:hypothetical protein